MRRVWIFLSDPGLHLLAIALFLIGLAIGSTSSQEPKPDSPLVHCGKCRAYHYMELAGPCANHAKFAQLRP